MDQSAVIVHTPESENRLETGNYTNYAKINDF